MCSNEWTIVKSKKNKNIDTYINKKNEKLIKIYGENIKKIKYNIIDYPVFSLPKKIKKINFIFKINTKNKVYNNYRENIKFLIIKHLLEITILYNIPLTNKYLINSIYNTIIYCFETESIICDGVNLAMTTIDKDNNNNYRPEHIKVRLRRNWNHVYNFVKDNKTILVLKDIIYKKPRLCEKNIDFTIFNNRCLWLKEGDKCIDDLIVIIIANILSYLYNKPYFYYSNDKFIDHKNFITKITSKFNTIIKPINLSYKNKYGFSLIKDK
jgi:hypothetical protein